MTPPTKIQSVDISAAQTLDLGKVFNPQVQHSARNHGRLLAGSDLRYNPFTDRFESRTVLGKELDVQKQDAWLEEIRLADKNQDHYLNVTEWEQALPKIPQDPHLKEKYLQTWMERLENQMAERYRPIAANLKMWEADLDFGFTMEALKLYSEGLFLEDMRQANSLLMLNKPVKIVGNAGLFLQIGAYNLAAGITGSEELPQMIMNRVAESQAQWKKNERDLAFSRLETVIRQGALQGENWVKEKNIQEALAQLIAQGNQDSYDVLTEQLPTLELHSILQSPDKDTVGQRLLEFANAERAQFLGWFGGGNTDDKDWLNWSGRRNNYYFALSTLHWLAKKHPNPRVSNSALATLHEIRGDDKNGSLSNFVWSWVPGNQRATWSDYYTQDFLGRLINFGMACYYSPKVMKGFKDMTTLKHGSSPTALYQLLTKGWMDQAKLWNPLSWNPLRGMGPTRPKILGKGTQGGGREMAEALNESHPFGITALKGWPYSWVDGLKGGLGRLFTRKKALETRPTKIGTPARPNASLRERLKKWGSQTLENYPKLSYAGSGFNFFVAVTLGTTLSEKLLLPQNQKTGLYDSEAGEPGFHYNPYQVDYDVDLIPWDEKPTRTDPGQGGKP